MAFEMNYAFANRIDGVLEHLIDETNDRRVLGAVSRSVSSSDARQRLEMTLLHRAYQSCLRRRPGASSFRAE